MTKDVIELAREAGMKFVPAQFSGVLETETDEFTVASFAALVAARVKERCAQLIAKQALRNGYPPLVAAAQDFAKQCAAAIRALNTEGEGHDRA
jgi:hypothetical protein